MRYATGTAVVINRSVRQRGTNQSATTWITAPTAASSADHQHSPD